MHVEKKGLTITGHKRSSNFRQDVRNLDQSQATKSAIEN